MKWNSRCSRDQ